LFLLWRSWSAFTALIATVLTALCILSVLQHNAVLSDLIRQRLSVVAQSAASPFHTVVDLGLPLSMMRNADEVLKRAKALDDNIEAIHVFNPSGIIAYSTDKLQPQPLSREELIQHRLHNDGKWSMETDTQFKSYVSIYKDNNWVGGILAIYPKQEFNATVQHVSRHVIGATGILLLSFSLLTFLTFRLRLSGAIRGAEMLQQWLHDIQTNKPHRSPTDNLDQDFIALRDHLIAADENYRYLCRELPVNSHELATNRIENSNMVAMVMKKAGKLEQTMTSVPETSLARTYARRLAPWSIGLILLSALSLGFITYQSVSDSFDPELAKRTDLIAKVASANIQRGVNAGIPLENMTGMDDYFSGLLANFPEISFFGVATGKFIFKAGNWQHSLLGLQEKNRDVPIYPITFNGESTGYIIIDPSPDYIAVQFREVVLDLLVIILVVLLLAYEIMIVVMSLSLTSPLNRLKHLSELQAEGDFSNRIQPRRGSLIEVLINHLSQRVEMIHSRYSAALQQLEKAGETLDLKPKLKALAKKYQLKKSPPRVLTYSYMNDVRLPLFLFAASDELALSFFPLFTRAAENPIKWLDPAIVISLPLAGYLLAYMLAAPFSRSLAERWGHNKLVLVSLSAVLLSNVFMYFATNVLEIIFLRTVAGGGYALAVLACQDYVIDAVPKNQRTQSLGIFSAALFGGIYSGTALGGVLADRFGTSSVFMFSALLVLISGMLFARMIPKGTRITSEQAPPLTLRSIFTPLRHRGFLAISMGLAVPQSVMDQVFISYLFSLQLDTLDASAADIARMLMVYFLMIMLAGSLLGALSKMGVEDRLIAILGSVLTGGGLLVAAAIPAQWSMLLAAACTGFGYGLLRGPQVELALKLSEGELKHLGSNSVLGALRLYERVGSIIGLLVIAAIAGYFGLSAAIGSIGLLILAGMLLFSFVYLSENTSDLIMKKK